MAFGLALRSFWKTLTDKKIAEAVALALDGEPLAPALPEPKPVEATKPDAATQSAAITLLAALQRDARLLDLVFENLDAYQDAQIGAAARPCLKQCRESLERLVPMERVLAGEENTVVDIPSNASATRVRWVDDAATGDRGRLVHAGWLAKSIELPVWTGAKEDANVLAPAQVQSAG